MGSLGAVYALVLPESSAPSKNLPTHIHTVTPLFPYPASWCGPIRPPLLVKKSAW